MSRRIDRREYRQQENGEEAPLLRPDGSTFLENVAAGIAARQRAALRKRAVAQLSFLWAIINCLGAGSIMAFSLYGPLFQKRLHYSQLQVNGVSIAAELAMYLPVPLFGIVCDRLGPATPSLFAGVLFGVGYAFAAMVYRAGPAAWPPQAMMAAFVPIGSATSCMYISAVTTCAKNFGRGRFKGLALALPIACFGLSGMWQAQVGVHLLYDILPEGEREVDVYRYFVFLAVFLSVIGCVGFSALRVEEDEQLIVQESTEYGTLVEEEEQSPKNADGLLNERTKNFLTDHTMWWLAAGFFLVTGPGEAFINNMGTVLDTLRPDNAGGAATHVSVVAATSTLARIATGTLTDLLAPTTDGRWEVSRVLFLIVFALIMSVGQVVLASGALQDKADLFWIVSASIGAGYGAVFSLVPIITSIVWGVENFGTNWGILATAPAVGATLWGLIYSAVYQRAAGPDGLCSGVRCYESTFWAMAASVWTACLLWLWAWRGVNGWRKREISV
ncbi:MFS general substrate transporter [Piedraia hortae CBS 480.64]|uniref:Probable transporter MCH1 n=1 Tax=Piedraia hortae CBS 480.64 TaxID=1314780 RepID=A0A6A7BX26_9PEZI|nr:MFS general substrate transporter [Piedraia hortae CBS 480.64]